MLPTPQLCRVRLARKPVVVWLHPTAQAAFLFALGASSQPVVAVLDCKAHVTPRCRASVKIRRRGHSTADASVVESVDDVLRQDALQVVVRDGRSAVWARDVHRSFREARLSIPVHATAAIPAMGASKLHCAAHCHVVATDCALDGLPAPFERASSAFEVRFTRHRCSRSWSLTGALRRHRAMASVPSGRAIC